MQEPVVLTCHDVRKYRKETYINVQGKSTQEMTNTIYISLALNGSSSRLQAEDTMCINLSILVLDPWYEVPAVLTLASNNLLLISSTCSKIRMLNVQCVVYKLFNSSYNVGAERNGVALGIDQCLSTICLHVYLNSWSQVIDAWRQIKLYDVLSY